MPRNRLFGGAAGSGGRETKNLPPLTTLQKGPIREWEKGQGGTGGGGEGDLEIGKFKEERQM
jgi:hypothetical protein